MPPDLLKSPKSPHTLFYYALPCPNAMHVRNSVPTASLAATAPRVSWSTWSTDPACAPPEPTASKNLNQRP